MASPENFSSRAKEAGKAVFWGGAIVAGVLWFIGALAAL